MMLTVLRRADGVDCTNSGLSSTSARIFVILPHYAADQKTPDDMPVFVLEQHHPGCLRLRPRDASGWPMFGGNFGHCSDSRFNEACERLLGHRFYGAVPIHDRFE